MLTVRRINLALLLLLLGASVWLWPSLPERLPVHFGLDGTVDRWSERSFKAWFTMPLVAVALNGLMLGVGAWSMRNPKWVNIPNKERLLRLPPERQRAVLSRLRAGFAVAALPLTLSFCLIQIGVLTTANGGDGRPFILAVLFVALLSGPIGMIALLIPFQRELERQVRAERGQPATPGRS